MTKLVAELMGITGFVGLVILIIGLFFFPHLMKRLPPGLTAVHQKKKIAEFYGQTFPFFILIFLLGSAGIALALKAFTETN